MKIYGINDNYGKTPTLESIDVLKETEKTYRTERAPRSLGFNSVHQKGNVATTPEAAWFEFLNRMRSERHRLYEKIAEYDRYIQEAKCHVESQEVARG